MMKCKSVNELRLRAVIEFLLLSIIFGILGYFIFVKIEDEVIASLEESVAQQGQSLAFGIDQQSKHEFGKLRTGAILVEQNKVSVEE